MVLNNASRSGFLSRNWEKSEMLNIDKKKLLVCALMTLLLSFAAASFAHAELESESTTSTTGDSMSESEDEPLLTMTEDGTVTDGNASGDDELLYQEQDSDVASQEGNEMLDQAQGEEDRSAEDQLYTAQSSSDYTVLIVGCVGLVSIAAVAVFVALFVRKRK
jgi:hypothetical protein